MSPGKAVAITLQDAIARSRTANNAVAAANTVVHEYIGQGVATELILLGGGYSGYSALGTGLLPEMDEGGFILDYIMPAGSSLVERNRVVQPVERIPNGSQEWHSPAGCGVTFPRCWHGERFFMFGFSVLHLTNGK